MKRLLNTSIVGVDPSPRGITGLTYIENGVIESVLAVPGGLLPVLQLILPVLYVTNEEQTIDIFIEEPVHVMNPATYRDQIHMIERLQATMRALSIVRPVETYIVNPSQVRAAMGLKRGEKKLQAWEKFQNSHFGLETSPAAKEDLYAFRRPEREACIDAIGVALAGIKRYYIEASDRVQPGFNDSDEPSDAEA